MILIWIYLIDLDIDLQDPTVDLNDNIVDDDNNFEEIVEETMQDTNINLLNKNLNWKLQKIL